MTHRLGRNINTSEDSRVTTYTLNGTTATVISPAYPQRTEWRVSLDSGISDIDVFIREYPAAQDNLRRGHLLTRRNSSNDTVFNVNFGNHPDNPYTGEYSAITSGGTVDVHVTERINGPDGV